MTSFRHLSIQQRHHHVWLLGSDQELKLPVLDHVYVKDILHLGFLTVLPERKKVELSEQVVKKKKQLF